ncbi:MAG TPA: hypothetical protein VFF13_00240 [archaeon]|nr:hypothetical protein [archaeon]
MKLKMFPAIALALIMLMSGFAVADDGNENDAENETRVGVQIRDLNKVGATARTNVDIRRGSNSDENDSDSDQGNNHRERNRAISAEIKERLENARENFQAQRDRIIESRHEYLADRNMAREHMSDFNALRERLKNANSQDKNKLRDELRGKSQQVLLNQVNAILHRLEAISGHENAPEDIGVSIEFFEGIKAELESGDLSREMLIEISKEIKDFWKEERLLLQKNIGVRLNNAINGIINKAETFSERIAAMIVRLEADGKDTNTLQEGLDKLNADIEKFKEVHAELEADLDAAETREDALAVLREAHNTLKRMNHQLIKDFRLMKAMFKATRELESEGEVSVETEAELNASVNEGSELEDDSEDEDESEEEDEEENENEGDENAE